MSQQRITPSQRSVHIAYLTAVCILVAVLFGVLTLSMGYLKDFETLGLSTASRTLNQFTAVMLTCIALIIPLTSNLYTPKLVKLYVTHPLIVAGLSLLVLSHLMAMALIFIPRHHLMARVLMVAITIDFVIVLTGTLPFLFGISHFLRPSYFVPMLTKKGIQTLHRLNRDRKEHVDTRDLFETIDVLTNLALTGMNRGDRQLVLLSLQSMRAFLAEFTGSGCQENQDWRERSPSFVPGLAREGQEYLTREKIWPEAYVLAQMLKVMEVSSSRQHEIVAELASHLVDTAHLAYLLERDKVVELHVMAFNSLVREAMEAKDLRKFQNLSYHYRILIEAFHDSPVLMHETAQHLVHYGKMAYKQNLHFALETVIYDMGELVLSVAGHDEDSAVDFVLQQAGPTWGEGMSREGLLSKVSWRALIRTYWEARAAGYERLSELLFEEYLFDQATHRFQLVKILSENRELHFEFNDRLMRFAHLSPEAENLARPFLEEEAIEAMSSD